MTVASAANPTLAADCMFEPQGEGRVIAILDGRTFRMEDGREVRLAGIEPITSEKGVVNGSETLSALVLNRSVTLRGENDSPDRYGRQPAFVFLDQADGSVQSLLVKQGKALVSPGIADRACAASLNLAEAAARRASRESGAIRRPSRAREIPALFWPELDSSLWSRGRFCRCARRERPPTSILGGAGHGTSR